jgi:hypothetical protein
VHLGLLMGTNFHRNTFPEESELGNVETPSEVPHCVHKLQETGDKIRGSFEKETLRLSRRGVVIRLTFSPPCNASGGRTHQVSVNSKNDFRLEIEHFSYCVLKVVSGKKAGLENQTDLWCMILQASCFVSQFVPQWLD